jgi:hypothetical protein
VILSDGTETVVCCKSSASCPCIMRTYMYEILPISWSEKNYHVRSVYALNEAG